MRWPSGDQVTSVLQAWAERQPSQRSRRSGWADDRGALPGTHTDENCHKRQDAGDLRPATAPSKAVMATGRGWLRRGIVQRLRLDRRAVLHGRHQPIAASRDGLDVARSVGGIAEDVAKPLHGGIEPVLEIDEGVAGPQALSQLVAGDEVPGTLDQRQQHLQGLLGNRPRGCRCCEARPSGHRARSRRIGWGAAPVMRGQACSSASGSVRAGLCERRDRGTPGLYRVDFRWDAIVTSAPAAGGRGAA